MDTHIYLFKPDQRPGVEGILLETWNEECDEKLWEGDLGGK